MAEDTARANSARNERPFQSSYEAPEKSDASSGPSGLSELKGATAASSPGHEPTQSAGSLLDSGGAEESQVVGLWS